MILAGTTTLVTGGAVRVGRAIALALAGRGANVAITYRASADEACATAAEISALGVRSHAVCCDQRDPTQVDAAVRDIEAELGPVSVLVNNAAIFNRTPFGDSSLEDWDSHLEVNLRGPWLFARAVCPGMQARGGGVVVNLVDIAGDKPYIAYLPYCISKAGLAAMTKGLARALAPAVRVNGIAIGTVLWPDDFPEAQKQATIDKTLLKRIGDPSDVASAVLFLVEGCDFLTGAIIPVDGGARLG